MKMNNFEQGPIRPPAEADSLLIMDESYLLACTRYIELNPVRAGLVQIPEAWLWSNAAAHIHGQNDRLVNSQPLLNMVTCNWRQFLMTDISESEIEEFRKFERTGRPLGEVSFIKRLESVLGRRPRPKRPGPQKKDK